MNITTQRHLARTIDNIKSYKSTRVLREIHYHLKEIESIDEAIDLLMQQKEQHYIMADHLTVRISKL